MAFTFCGKKSEVGASVSYGHTSSLIQTPVFAVCMRIKFTTMLIMHQFEH